MSARLAGRIAVAGDRDGRLPGVRSSIAGRRLTDGGALRRLSPWRTWTGSPSPCIRGLRMTVSDVLDYLASGMSEEDLLRDFPDLTREDIRASLAFAADR